QDRRTVTILALALCLVYVAVRFWRLTDSCLWFDEIFSAHAAEHSWNLLLRFVAQDLIHPPLFYAALKLWIGIGGESLLWLRLLPVLFSAIALVPVIYLCKELKLSNSVMLMSLAFLAVNGSLIKYTQTVRMYSMLMCLSLVSIWLFARYFNRGKSFITLLIVNLLLVYTHYFGWLVIAAEISAILIFQRIKWRRMATMTGILLASFLPWVVAVFQASRSGSDVGQNISWMTRPGLREMIAFLFDLTEPFYFQASNGEPASMYLVSVPVVIILLAALVIYFVEWKRDENKQRLYFLFLFVAIPAIAAFVVSWISPYSVWGTRHLIVIYAPAAILLAHFITRIPVSWVRTAAVTLLLLFSGYAFYLQATRTPPRYVWCEWENVANEIKGKETTAEGKTKIYAFENLVAYHLWFALRDSDRYQVQVVKGVDVRTDDETYFLPRGFEAVKNAQLDEITEGNLWLAFRASKAGDDLPILAAFDRQGYRICSTNSAAYDQTTVFWMKMTRSGEGCAK
ncbi:MAG: glycosyltransferase family 39 protein, partial [Acidobacteriota bacterium]